LLPLLIGKYLTTSITRGNSTEKNFKYLKPNRLRTRRKTNPDSESLYKFTFSSKKKMVSKFSPK